MPRPPGFIDKVNYIVDFVQDPCDAPWTVYLETAIKPTGELVLALLEFGIDDIIRGYARPSGLRSFNHLRRKRKGQKGSGGIPEIGEMIGKKLPGAKLLRARKVSQGVKVLWLIDGVIQRFLWYWLVIDLATEFLYSWTSLVNQSIYCQIGEKDSVAAEGKGTGFLALSGWIPVFCTDVLKQRGFLHWDRGILTVTRVPVHISAGCEIMNTGIDPQTFEMRISKAADRENPLDHSVTELIPPGATAGCVVSATITEPGSYALEGRINIGFAVSVQEIMSAQGR